MPTLHDYFVQQHDKSLSAEDKLKIYQRFLDKSHRVLMRHRVAYYSRVTAFCVLTLVMAGGAFYLFSPNGNPYEMSEQNEGLVAFRSKDGQFAYADPVGRIITARGEMVITTPDGETVDGSDLHDNDKVILKAWAEILLTVSDGFQAKIIGPAIFMIEDGGMQGDVHVFTINLLEGDFLQLAKIEEPVKRNAPVQSVVVKTDEFHLEELHASSESDVNLVISTTTEGKKAITNHGDDLLVKKIVEDDEKNIYAAVGEDQTVLVNGDIELAEEDVEELVKDIEDKQLTIRYDIDGDSALDAAIAKHEQDEDNKDETPTKEALDKSQDSEEATAALTTLMWDDEGTKQMIDEKIMSQLTAALSYSSVSQYLDQIE